MEGRKEGRKEGIEGKGREGKHNNGWMYEDEDNKKIYNKNKLKEGREG